MAKKNYLVDIDLNKNQLLNAKLQNLSVHPTVTVTTDEGFTYYNTTDETVYVYTGVGTIWKNLGLQGTVTNVSSANILHSTVSDQSIAPIITIVSAPKLTTGRNITITGDLAYTSPSFDGSGNVNASGTLATVNTNVGTFGSSTLIPVVTVNAKGLITAMSTAIIPSGSITVTGGDLTLSGSTGTNITNATLSAVSTAGTTGSSTAIPVITIDEKGRTTLISTVAVIAPAGTLTGTVLAANVTASSLVTFGNSPTFTGTVTVPLTPVNATDAASKGYVDAFKQGLDFKDSVRVASTANIAIASALINGSTIDSVTVSTGDRVLLKNQTTASQNGIYVVVASGAASRSNDANSNTDVTSGMYAFVSEGTLNASTGYVLTTPDPITLGTTSLNFTQFSGTGQIIAGNGLVKSGNTIDAVGTAAGTAPSAGNIVVIADSINIGTNVVTLSDTQTLTNKSLTSPSLTGIPIAPTASIGINSTQVATTAFVKNQGYSTTTGTVRKFVSTLSTSATSYTLTHGLSTLDLSVTIRDTVSPFSTVEAEIVIDPATPLTVVINFNVAPNANRFVVTVLG